MELFTNITSLTNDIKIIYRAGFAFLTSVLFVIFTGNYFIRIVGKIRQPIRRDGPNHSKKRGTPTMGGILIIIAFVLSSLLWTNINQMVLIILISSILFALIGFLDDILKIARKNSQGLSGKVRLFFEFLIAIGIMYFLLIQYPSDIATQVFFPFIYSFYIPLGAVGIIIFSSFVIVGTANSINLTDGLDSLAAMVSFTLLLTILVVAFLIIHPVYYNNFNFSSLFYFNYIREIIVVISALIGAILGFMWFNSYPAKIFMGDVGSLGIGGAIGTIIVSLKQEIFLVIAGLFIILESLSVIIQVYWFKYTKTRYFLMAPLHHHFEKKGIPETIVVKRIWIFTVIMCIIAILLLDIF